MFDDIVANTNPVLAMAHSEISEMGLFINPTNTIFNVKNNLIRNNNRSGSTASDGESRGIAEFRHATYKNPASECGSDVDKEMDFDQEDHDLGGASDFSNEDDRQMMLDFVRLKPTNEEDVGGIYRPRERLVHSRLVHLDKSRDDQELVQTSPNDQLNRPFDVEYENCRSQCGDHFDLDHGLDSTFCFSLKDDQLNQN